MPILLLVVIAAIGPIALNIFMPSMPGMQIVFGVDYATVQLTLTFYLAAMAVSQLIFGPFSDRFGRRPLLIIGVVMFVIGSTLATLAESIEVLIIARIIQGFGGASGMALSRAIIRDCYSRERSASMLGYMTMGMVVGPMVSPLVGGLLDENFGWRSSFAGLVGLGVIVLAAVILLLRETKTDRDTGKVFAPLITGAVTLSRSKAFWAYAGTAAFATGAFFAFLAAAPYIAIDLMDLPPSTYGKYFPLGAVGYMTGNFLSGRYSERFGPDRMIMLGNIVGICATLMLVAIALAGVLHPFTLFLPLMFVALSNGLVLPSATASVVSIHPELAGAAAGIAGALQLTVGAVMTVIMGLILDDTQLPMALVMTAAIWASIACALIGRRALRREASVLA